MWSFAQPGGDQVQRGGHVVRGMEGGYHGRCCGNLGELCPSLSSVGLGNFVARTDYLLFGRCLGCAEHGLSRSESRCGDAEGRTRDVVQP